METRLLATKVRKPPQPHHVIPRARLLDTLEGATDYKLLVISAPAGYGKTTLLTQWSHMSRARVAWLSLSETDNNLEQFLRYLLTAWDEVQSGVRQSPVGLILGASIPEYDAVLTAFINLAQAVADPLVFVLDDYDQIVDPSIHDTLTFLIDYAPPNLHFVLVSRAEPPLPLARYRARRELLELRTEDVQFLPDETADFLHQVPGLQFTDDEVATLHTQLEGWVAGLQLVSLSLQRHVQPPHTLAISGQHRFIADYLSEDVFSHLSHDMRHFLLQTCIVESLCGPLCDALTAGAGGQAMLERLERENLFLVALDDHRHWFRYHRLFADFLKEELKRRFPGDVNELHRRAAHWYLDNDLPDTAFQHAVKGGDVELVVHIVDHYCSAKLNSGEIRVVQGWVDALPEEWYTDYPVLGIAKVGLLAFTGAVDACLRSIDDVEQQLIPAESDASRWQLARVTAVRCLLACIQNDLMGAEAYANAALQTLPQDDPHWRSEIYGALGDTYRQHGRWGEAQEWYLKAMAVNNVPELRFMSAHVLGALADLALRQGQLRTAAEYWNKALNVIQDRETWGRVPLPVIGWVYIRLGELLYEWNELPEAWNYLSQGLERAELGGDVRALLAGYVIASRLKLAEGDVSLAKEYLERARPLLEQSSFAEWIYRFERVQLDIWLSEDQRRKAIVWANKMLKQEAFEGPQSSDLTRLTVARALLAKGDAPALHRALTLLKHLIEMGEADGRMDVKLEALTLQALAHWQAGERAGALTALEHALRLAEPEGYVRRFADLGLPMARLLQEAYARSVMPDYVAKLLAVLGTELAFPGSSAERLPEPLSQREHEILNLLAAGLTNQEIADTLVISPETVKKHTSAIYGKMGVTNRTEAAARARALNLLN